MGVDFIPFHGLVLLVSYTSHITVNFLLSANIHKRKSEALTVSVANHVDCCLHSEDTQNCPPGKQGDFSPTTEGRASIYSAFSHTDKSGGENAVASNSADGAVSGWGFK